MQTSTMKSLCKGLFCKALLFTAFFAAAVSARGTEDDTLKAYVPILLNRDATVRIEPAQGVVGTGAQKRVTANKLETLTLILNHTGPVSVSHRAQKRYNAAASFRQTKGNVSLSLDPQSYKNATVSLYAVNGRQVLRGKASAAKGALDIQRQNVAAGVYMLSVRGTNGASFSSKLNHNGGKINISVAFADKGSAPALRKGAKAAAESYGDWIVTITGAAGYADSVYTFSPVEGENEAQEVTLSEVAFINGPDEAWTMCEIDPEDEEGDVETCFGLVFNDDGTFKIIAGASGMWMPILGGDYSVSGNSITLIVDEEPQTGTYSVSGNTLTWTTNGETFILTRTPLPPVTVTPGGGGNLELPAEKAWTDRHEYGAGESAGMIFAAGGILYNINDYDSGDESWTIDGIGTWSASDGILTVDPYGDGDVMEIGYTVSGETLTMTFMGFPMVYKVTDVGPIEFPFHALSKAKAKVRSTDRSPTMLGKKKLSGKKPALMKSIFNK